MGWTEITYQGFVATSCVFNRSRGYDPDVSTVDILVASFPEGFELEVPDPRGVRNPVATEARNELPRRFASSGLLVMAERQGVEEFRVPVPLWVVAIERIDQSMPDGSPAFVRVSLVDERAFWGLGMLRRHSWNRLNGRGEVIPMTVGTRRQAAAAVCADLFLSPELSEAPEEWSSRSGPIEFAPLGAPIGALRQLAEDAACVEPCLRLDGTVALYRPGQGRVGFAPQGKGPNSQDLPGAPLYEGGSGDSHRVELTHAPAWVVVRGAERVATVRLRCEPVLVLPTSGTSTVLALTDENVRLLTNGAWGLDGLRKFVLMPAAYQAIPGLPKEVARLLAGDAWRLWRIEGLGDEDGGAGAQKAIGEFLGSVAAGRAGLAAARPADAARKPRNDHVLPILDRAETAGPGGQRRPPMVEREGYRVVHVDFEDNDPDSPQAKLRSARERLAANMEAIKADAKNRNRSMADVLGLTGTLPGAIEDNLERGLSRFDLSFPGDREELSLADTVGFDLLGQLVGAGANPAHLSGMLGTARELEAVKELNSQLAGQRKQAYDDLYTATDAVNGGGTYAVEWSIAQRIVALERQAREARTLFQSGRESLEKNAGAARLDLQTELRELAQQLREAQRVATQSRGTDEEEEEARKPKIRHLNRPLAEDREAIVFSDKLGIFRTSALAGTLNPEGLYALESAEFMPGPVWATFGAVVRPESSVGRPTTQVREPGAVLGPLEDAPTYFVRAFQRGAGAIDLGDVPQGRAQTIVREDLGPELIPLEGSGNARQLELEAQALADDFFKTPERIDAAVQIFGRPLPVQCDGVVASMSIESFSDPAEGTGFKTTIQSGYRVAPVGRQTGQTRTRPPRPKDLQDGARREGLRP